MAQLLVNNYNVGTDLQDVVIIPSNGTGGGNIEASTLGHLEELHANQIVTKDVITPVLYKGKRLKRNIYHDFEGRLMFTRYNGALTQQIIRIIQRFQSTGEESFFTIYATVNDVDDQGNAGLSEYVFQRVIFDAHELGPFTGLASVKSPLNFQCQALSIGGQ